MRKVLTSSLAILIVVSSISANASSCESARSNLKVFTGDFDVNHKQAVELWKTEDLTMDIKTSRKGKVLIEKTIGVCLNKNGDGAVIGTDKYTYINYKCVEEVSPGDIVCTYCVYNPESNYEDDIIARGDVILSRQNPLWF